jgi:signal transduction histidine kinase
MNPTFNNGDVGFKLPYKKENKTFISGFAAIKNNSEIVGLLQIDMIVDDIFPSPADFFLLPVIACIIVILLGMLIIKYILEPLQESIDSLSVHFINLADGEFALKYVEPDKGYLHEISTLLDKLQAGFSRKLMSDEDKENTTAN